MKFFKILACLGFLIASISSIGAYAGSPPLCETGIPVTLQADSGNYLARCTDCVGNAKYPDSAFVQVTPAEVKTSSRAHFYLQRLSNGKYTLRSSDSGKYLAECENCSPNGISPDMAFIYVSHNAVKQTKEAQFTLVELANGKYAFQASSGNYLARCNGCVYGATYPDSADFHTSAADMPQSPWAQWTITILAKP